MQSNNIIPEVHQAMDRVLTDRKFGNILQEIYVLLDACDSEQILLIVDLIDDLNVNVVIQCAVGVGSSSAL